MSTQTITEEYNGRPITLKTVVTPTKDSKRDVAARHLAALDQAFVDHPAIPVVNLGMVHKHFSAGVEHGVETTCGLGMDGPTWQAKHRNAVALQFEAYPQDLPTP